MKLIKKVIFFSFALFVTQACKKDVAIPAHELEELYGEWQMFTFDGSTAVGVWEEYDEIHFRRNQELKKFYKGKLVSEEPFWIERYSYVSGGNRYTYYSLFYERNRLYNVDTVKETIWFRNNDTLLLQDVSISDYPGNFFVRKK